MKPVEIELGGAKRRLALNENAIIALYDLTGDDFFALGQRLAAKTHDESGNALLGEDGKPIAPVLYAEKLRITRLLAWALLSQSQNWDGRRETLRIVTEWLADPKKKVEMMEACGRIIEDYLSSMGIASREFEGQLAPFVPTPHAVVECMLDVAQVRGAMHVVDLGAGDGRLLLAALDRGASACGYELHAGRYEALKAKIAAHPNGDCACVYQCDIREAAIELADVVFLYLLQSSNAELKPKLLRECKPGALIVSHDFSMPDWKAETIEHVHAEGRMHTVYVYRVPVPAALTPAA
jgi:hypothetical protein